MQLIADTEYMRIEHDPARSLLWVTRTHTPFPSIDQAIQSNQAVVDLLRARPARFLCLDSRPAPGRNDDEFEQAMRPVFTSYITRFERVAMLVRTAVGRLQMQRLSRSSPVPIGVFSTDEEALAFLVQPGP